MGTTQSTNDASAAPPTSGTQHTYASVSLGQFVLEPIGKHVSADVTADDDIVAIHEAKVWSTECSIAVSADVILWTAQSGSLGRGDASRESTTA